VAKDAQKDAQTQGIAAVCEVGFFLKPAGYRSIEAVTLRN